jgi:hypothetical protein
MAALVAVPRVSFPARPVVSLVDTRWSIQPLRSVKLTVELCVVCLPTIKTTWKTMQEIPAFMNLVSSLP